MYVIYSPFLLNLGIAFLLSMATAPAHKSIKNRTNTLIASSILSFLLFFMLFGPIFYFIVTATTFLSTLDLEKVRSTIAFITDLTSKIPDFALAYKQELEQFLSSIDVSNLSQKIIAIFSHTGLKTASFITDIVFIVIFFFFFHMYGKIIADFLVLVVPYTRQRLEDFFLNLSSTMSVVSYSIVFTALFEGLLFGIFVSMFGYDFVLFSILYGFASLIPIVGGFVMWFPISMYEASIGNYQNAIIIVAYTIVVISIIADTFVRPMIINVINKKFNKSGAQIHSMMIFFSIIAGLSVFGFWGAIIGPGVTAIFVGVLRLIKEQNLLNEQG